VRQEPFPWRRVHDNHVFKPQSQYHYKDSLVIRYESEDGRVVHLVVRRGECNNVFNGKLGKGKVWGVKFIHVKKVN